LAIDPNTRREIGEVTLLVFRHGRQLGFVHPERPFRRWHHDLRIRECELLVLGPKAVDMVSVEVRDHDGINLFRIETGRGQIVHEARRGRNEPAGGAGIDEHELRAGIDHERRKRNHHLVGALELIVECFLRVGNGEILEQSGREVRHPDAIVNGGDFVGADLVAVEARGLLARKGRSSAGGLDGRERADGRRCRYGGGAGEQAAAGELGHGVSSNRLFAGQCICRSRCHNLSASR
jgi:hypothetical protein